MEKPPFTIIHPVHERSELSAPFIHALSLVYVSKGELEIVDVRRNRKSLEKLSIRRIYEKWGILPLDSAREDVGRLGIKIKKIITKGNAKRNIAKLIRRHPHDILVVGFKHEPGISHLFGGDLTEYLIQYFRQTTLYFPSGAKSFVNKDTGEVNLKKIVLPVAEEPSSEPSFQMLQRILKVYPDQSPQVYGLHVGEIFPRISSEYIKDLSFKKVLFQGNIVHAIASLADKENADLVIMSTNGRDTFSQKIIGSITEQVLRNVSCPVLAVIAV